jgi:RimJ/RimL family protein N-acetyltransferase
VIRGERIALRARFDTDVPRLHAQLYGDVRTRSRADTRPWVPLPPGRSPYAAEPSPQTAVFSVIEPAAPDDGAGAGAGGDGDRDGDGGGGERLVGAAVLWGIDTHNRSAHLGVSLFPGERGRGFGVDVVRVLCEYGFAVRGLRRLQIETLADNAAMLAAARKAGFTVEGTLRSAAWTYGEFADEVILGLLAEEWRAAGGGALRR